MQLPGESEFTEQMPEKHQIMQNILFTLQGKRDVVTQQNPNFLAQEQTPDSPAAKANSSYEFNQVS